MKVKGTKKQDYMVIVYLYGRLIIDIYMDSHGILKNF